MLRHESPGFYCECDYDFDYDCDYDFCNYFSYLDPEESIKHTFFYFYFLHFETMSSFVVNLLRITLSQ